MKFAIAILVPTLILSPVAHAQDSFPVDLSKGEITQLSANEPAPFEGVLFDNDAAANLIVEIESAKKSCELKVEKAQEINDIEWQLKYDRLEAEMTFVEAKHDAMIESRDDIITVQQEALDKAGRPKTEIYFAAGVGAGIALTILSAWGYGQVAR